MAIAVNASRVVTGSSSAGLKRWVLLEEGGLELDQEMQLDGGVAGIWFDACMRLGVAATTGGTLWYIDWPLRSSIRLVAGHRHVVSGSSWKLKITELLLK